MTTAESLITPALAADVANALTSPEALEKFWSDVPAQSVTLYLAMSLDAATNLRAFIKGGEQRLNADGETGQHYTVNGVEYGFFGSVQKGYKDFPGLVRFLIEDCDMDPLAIAAATSDARVTDLRQAATALADPEACAAALEEIEAHRVQKGERGSPRFQAISDYVK